MQQNRIVNKFLLPFEWLYASMFSGVYNPLIIYSPVSFKSISDNLQFIIAGSGWISRRHRGSVNCQLPGLRYPVKCEHGQVRQTRGVVRADGVERGTVGGQRRGQIDINEMQFYLIKI